MRRKDEDEFSRSFKGYKDLKVKISPLSLLSHFLFSSFFLSFSFSPLSLLF